MRPWFYFKYQLSSWPATFYPRPLIWKATDLSKHLFWEIIGLFVGLFIRLFRSLDQNGCNHNIWLNKICFIISCSWPLPILTLLRRSGGCLRTFRFSVQIGAIIKITCCICWNLAAVTEKNKIQFMFSVRFRFGLYVKAFIAFKVFYFFGSVLMHIMWNGPKSKKNFPKIN